MGVSIDYYTNYEEKEMIEKYNEFLASYKKKIECLIAKAFGLEGFNLPNVYIGIGVVTESEIKEINNEYRKVDKSTDVLSFPIFTREELTKMKESNVFTITCWICQQSHIVIAQTTQKKFWLTANNLRLKTTNNGQEIKSSKDISLKISQNEQAY